MRGKLHIKYTPPLPEEQAKRYAWLYTKVCNDLLSVSGTPEKEAQRLYRLMLKQKDPVLGVQRSSLQGINCVARMVATSS